MPLWLGLGGERKEVEEVKGGDAAGEGGLELELPRQREGMTMR